MPSPHGPIDGLVVAPSILSADFSHLAQEVRAAVHAGADWIHVDVMDGRFVPNITVGPLVVQAVRACCSVPLDVHLMIAEPDRYLEDFAKAGADVITVHAEVCTHLLRSVARIRELGVRAGVALNPHTSEQVLTYAVDAVDLVLVMTVNPGFGGQAFIPSVVPKIERIRALLREAGHSVLIEVDGGIGPSTAGVVAAAGARILVAGSAVFGAQDYATAVAAIRQAATDAMFRQSSCA